MNNRLISCINILLFSALSLSASAGTPENGDPWVREYRQFLENKSSTINNKDGEPIKFFNGFSMGVSGGLGLFHGSLADYDMFAPLDDFDSYYNFAWRVYAAREIKWGLGAKLQFEKGELSGGRLPGKESLPVDFETKYNTLSGLVTFDLFNALFNKKKGLENHKFYAFAEVGIGVTFYRSFTTWRPVGTQQGEIRDFYGYTVQDDMPPTQRYLLKGRTSPEVALNFPVGFTAGYRINHKADITFSYTLNNTTTKQLDAWSREFNSNDKYSYFGVGVRYNFNREKEQYPKKKEKEPKEKKDKKWSLFGSKKDDVQPADVKLSEPIESRKSNKITDGADNNDNGDLEEIRMKMFELQLKLFEMQYLLNGGDKENTPKTPAPTK
ncbi:MAG: hypothetical protein ABR574_04845 [Cryomorphaceae bacterium]|nr:hypothetical protein [Flavobacteriales bacterium]